MYETLNYYQLIQQSLADTSLRNNYSEGEFIGTFLQHDHSQIIPLLNNPVSSDFVSYTLLFFIFGIAVIWNFLPERFFSVFNISTKKGFSRAGEVTYKTPGALISFFFILNFLFSFAFFIFLLLKTFASDYISGMSNLLVITYILVAVSLFYLFRLTFIKVSGFVFKTGEKSTQQFNLYINTENALGVLLIPILLLNLFAGFNYILLAGILLLIIFQIIRWVKTFFIGMSLGGFSVLHLILYLCTLEIIPILVVIKLVENTGVN